MSRSAQGIPTVQGLREGKPAVVARAITLLEQGGAGAEALRQSLANVARRSRRIVVTGPGGVGKSSLLREVCRLLRRDGERVAIVATDPSSVVTGGALLGDRCRFGDLLADRGVFVRSLAHRGVAGKPAPAAPVAADVLEVAGFDWVFLETVGTGQMDVGVFDQADVRVLVLAPECGDDVQMLKAGLVEVADLIAVGKSDQPGADAWAQRLRRNVERGAGEQAAPVVGVSAQNGLGIESLVAELRQLAPSARQRD